MSGDARDSDRAAKRFAAVVARIPRGRVATYGQVAALAGRPRAARQVGRWLFHLPEAQAGLPWHRVIGASGRVPASPSRRGSDVLQVERLAAEGVSFSRSGRIDLERHLWRPRLRQPRRSP